MAEQDMDNSGISPHEAEITDPSCQTDLPVGMTLESIIDLTGEMEHLNELVMLHLDNTGGFTCPAAYFTAVQPLLDLLEVEIRVRYRPGMSRREMKHIVQDWIDTEISSLQ
jgi:hypothetical protein